MDVTSILGTLIVLGLTLLGWALRTIYNKLTAQDLTLSELTVKSNRMEVGLFGYDGQNGINGTVKKLAEKVDALQVLKEAKVVIMPEQLPPSPQFRLP